VYYHEPCNKCAARGDVICCGRLGYACRRCTRFSAICSFGSRRETMELRDKGRKANNHQPADAPAVKRERSLCNSSGSECTVEVPVNVRASRTKTRSQGPVSDQENENSDDSDDSDNSDSSDSSDGSSPLSSPFLSVPTMSIPSAASSASASSHKLERDFIGNPAAKAALGTMPLRRPSTKPASASRSTLEKPRKASQPFMIIPMKAASTITRPIDEPVSTGQATQTQASGAPKITHADPINKGNTTNIVAGSSKKAGDVAKVDHPASTVGPEKERAGSTRLRMMQGEMGVMKKELERERERNSDQREHIAMLQKQVANLTLQLEILSKVIGRMEDDDGR